MDFETFKKELANSVKERFDSKRGEEYSVTLNKVDKANETYDAVTVRPESSIIGVNISATKAFEEYENGKNFDSIAAQVADAASRAIEGRPDFDLDAISSLYKAFGYEDVIEVYSRIKDSQMQQVDLAQLRVLAEF